MAITKQISARFIAIAVLIVVVASAAALIVPKILNSESDVMLGDAIFKTVVAKNSTDRSLFLEKVASLQSKNALMLAYPSNSRWSVNASELSSVVDIVWLDSNKRIVSISRNVSNSNGRLIPNDSSRYIILLSAGTVSSESIAIGQYANFAITDSEVE